MKLLIDANLAPRVAAALRANGHEAVHVGDIGLLSGSDGEILEWADEHGHAVVTADSDFAMMLAVSGASGPSVVQLRGVADQPPATHEALLLENVPAFSDALAAGAIVSLSISSFRIRDLPIEQIGRLVHPIAPATGRNGRVQANQPSERYAWDASVKAAALALGWRAAGGGVIYRTNDEYVFELSAPSPGQDCEQRGSIMAKPLALDPIFWEIIGSPELLRKRVTFRVNGAFTVPLLQVGEVSFTHEWTPAAVVKRLHEQFSPLSVRVM